MKRYDVEITEIRQAVIPIDQKTLLNSRQWNW